MNVCGIRSSEVNVVFAVDRTFDRQVEEHQVHSADFLLELILLLCDDYLALLNNVGYTYIISVLYNPE